MTKFLIIILLTTQLLCLINAVFGHGMVLDPVNRASRWRYNSSAPADYNDSEGFCGGLGIHWVTNGGKCGICGDNYANPRPRAHELGGQFGEGVVVAKYVAGQKVTVQISITANHRGNSWFELCNMDSMFAKGTKMEEEECFKTKVLTVDGEENWWLPTAEVRVFDVDLKMPEDVTCNHCVFRWTWRAGMFAQHCMFEIFLIKIYHFLFFS